MSVDRGAWLSHDEEQTLRFAAAVAAQVDPGVVVALRGELGAGKTRFVRGLAEGMGIDEESVSSPTYTLCHEHRGPQRTLLHLDAWRLHDPEELDEIGWEEILERRDATVAVEWPERLGDRLPDERVDVLIEALEERVRRITVVGSERLVRALRTVSPIPPAPVETTRCRVCGAALAEDALDGIFCSDRCRSADLGRWFEGRYAIARPIEEDDLAEE